jgi:hypothetical protein
MAPDVGAARPEHDHSAEGNRVTKQKDLAHLAWAIDHRAKIQHTMLALLELVRETEVSHAEWVKPNLMDHLIAASFSLWRAVFLAEKVREIPSIQKAQEAFLVKVISTNAITFGDDLQTSAWTVSYYLEAAKLRIAAAHNIAAHHLPDESLKDIIPLIRLVGTGQRRMTRYEWECAHRAVRILLKLIYPGCKVEPEPPHMPIDDDD